MLHRSPSVSAIMQVDVHVSKMILESAQLLSTAHHILDGDDARSGIYKPTHINHPSAIWVREARDNYRWLYQHMKHLSKEHKRRTGNTHLTWIKMRDVLVNSPANIPAGSTPIRLATGDIDLGCPVKSYRKYYNNKLREWQSMTPHSTYIKWTGRSKPKWIKL